MLKYIFSFVTILCICCNTYLKANPLDGLDPYFIEDHQVFLTPLGIVFHIGDEVYLAQNIRHLGDGHYDYEKMVFLYFRKIPDIVKK